MTPKEITAALAALKKEIGSRADLMLAMDANATRCTIWPAGIGVGRAKSIIYKAKDGDTFADIIAGINAAWIEQGDRAYREMIRSMALEIITITADQGRCSDAALRMKFTADDIKTFGERAIAEANEIADRGPFSIEFHGLANGAPADAEAADAF